VQNHRSTGINPAVTGGTRASAVRGSPDPARGATEGLHRAVMRQLVGGNASLDSQGDWIGIGSLPPARLNLAFSQRILFPIANLGCRSLTLPLATMNMAGGQSLSGDPGRVQQE